VILGELINVTAYIESIIFTYSVIFNL
jgi:hypothetical protein